MSTTTETKAPPTTDWVVIVATPAPTGHGTDTRVYGPWTEDAAEQFIEILEIGVPDAEASAIQLTTPPPIV